MRRLPVAPALALVAVMTLTGCASSFAPAGAGDAVSGTVEVYAAASLQRAFDEIAVSFEQAHPEIDVATVYDGSRTLATQIQQGAPADVFASADEKNMTKLTDAGLVDLDTPVDFATNTLEIAVPPSNPAGITGFADLANPDAKVVICAPQVPCGSATVTVEQASGIDITPVSEESSVTDVLGKVTSGEADAGLVYVTDVIAAGDAVEGIEFPESSEAVNTYPIATVQTSANVEAAEAFVAFVTGEVGLGVLAAAGFGAP